LPLAAGLEVTRQNSFREVCFFMMASASFPPETRAAARGETFFRSRAVCENVMHAPRSTVTD
jgi:hypothetical protein